MCVLVFNDSFHIRQQGFQLQDDPRHGVGHGLQSQGVAVEQHEAQIFFARGFDDGVLRINCLVAKPVQELRKHRELVQSGRRVHCIYMCVASFAGILCRFACVQLAC